MPRYSFSPRGMTLAAVATSPVARRAGLERSWLLHDRSSGGRWPRRSYSRVAGFHRACRVHCGAVAGNLTCHGTKCRRPGCWPAIDTKRSRAIHPPPRTLPPSGFSPLVAGQSGGGRAGHERGIILPSARVPSRGVGRAACQRPKIAVAKVAPLYWARAKLPPPSPDSRV